MANILLRNTTRFLLHFTKHGKLLNGKKKIWLHSSVIPIKLPAGTTPRLTANRNIHTTRSRMGREFFIDETALARAQAEAEKCPFPVYYMELTACKELYQSLASKGEDRPVNGLEFNVAYIDTQPYASKDVPVVVCLHGAPGGHWDFNHLISYLNEHGVRVIAINFPGYTWTKMDAKYQFRSTGDEKAAFVKDFLERLGITKVDVGIAHSAGTFPSMILSTESMNLYRSLVLINPAGLDYHKTLQPYTYMKFHARFYRNPIMRPLVLSFLKLGLMAVGYGNTNAHHMSVALETLNKIPYQQYRDIATAMANRQFPVSLIHSLNDKAVEASLSEDFSQRLGGTKETISKYDEAGECTEMAKKVDPFIHQHVFASGGHFLMKRYPQRINEIVFKFLKNVLEKK